MKLHAMQCLGCTLTAVLLWGATPVEAAEPMHYWEQQRRGANCSNTTVEPAYWRAAAAAGIEYVRLVPDSWQSQERDFLIGNADAFSTLVAADLAMLLQVLDEAHAHGVRVVLGFFSQPGARWRQLNDNVDDHRLWNDLRYHQQAASFWRQLAAATHTHPALVGYNPLNEPHPERAHDVHDPDSEAARRWFAAARGTAADVDRFHHTVLDSIRSVTTHMPVLLDGPFYAAPGGLAYVQPFDDPAVLYAVHYYGAWRYVTYRVNQGRFAYPDRMPTSGDSTRAWSQQTLQEHLGVVEAWRRQHDIPRHRVMVSEFGVDRRVEGAEAFLRDTIRTIDGYGYHWAFYAYRGDGSWGGMDYELGTGRLGWAYWQAVERGEDPEDHKKRGDNPLWAVIQEGLRGR